MNIRPATLLDIHHIQKLYAIAFQKEESDRVAKLATDLLLPNAPFGPQALLATAAPPNFSWIAQLEDKPVGHIAFSPVFLQPDGEERAYILAPLAVSPLYQKQGIGSQLVRHGLQHLTALGVNTVLVYGDPRFYSKFGFAAELARHFSPPYPLQFQFGWQAMGLHNGKNETNRFFAHQLQHPNEGLHIGKKEIKRVNVVCVAALCDPSLW